MPTTPVLTPKHRQYLRVPGRVPATRAAAHIRKLRAANLTDTQLRTAAHISISTLHRAAHQHGRIATTTERRILAIPIPPRPTTATSRATTPPHGTRRRLQALVHAGWPPVTLATTLGIRRARIHLLLHQEHGPVTIATATRVSALFQHLWDQQPEEHGVRPIAAHRARLLAARHGFAPALAWDNIDAADAVPDLGVEVSRVRAVVEDTAELVLEGLSREGIAVRLGIGWDAVRQAHRRAGVPLPVVWE
jgi:hypothetical protein